MSVNLWYEKNHNDLFFLHKLNGGEIPFITGIKKIDVGKYGHVIPQYLDSHGLNIKYK